MICGYFSIRKRNRQMNNNISEVLLSWSSGSNITGCVHHSDCSEDVCNEAETSAFVHNTMNVVVTCVTLVWCCLLLSKAGASPRRVYDGQPSQACGDKLADIMKLVCYGRGYNVAFRPQGRSSHRIRRGIVEECCRKSCSPSMLELYCQAEPLETTSNIQIRKRSDSGVDSKESNKDNNPVLNTAATEINKFSPLENDIKLKEVSTITSKEGKETYKLLNLLVSSEHNPRKYETKNGFNKLIQNDTAEEELNRLSTVPPLRHHKGHHNKGSLHGFKASSKTKREKSADDGAQALRNGHPPMHYLVGLLNKLASGENTQTFQIGTMKPYFSGRALASYRSSYQRHT